MFCALNMTSEPWGRYKPADTILKDCAGRGSTNSSIIPRGNNLWKDPSSDYTLVSSGREVAGSTQRRNPDMNEWIQNDWGTKTREQCWCKFPLPTFAPFSMNVLHENTWKNRGIRGGLAWTWWFSWIFGVLLLMKTHLRKKAWCYSFLDCGGELLKPISGSRHTTRDSIQQNS